MKKNEHNDQFLPSGCLTLEAIRQYSEGSLSLPEKTAMEKHLESCELCRDAFEGFGLVSDQTRIETVVSEINENIGRNYGKQRQGYKPRTAMMNHRLFYVSAAASVILVAGLYLLMSNVTSDYKTQSIIAESIETEDLTIPPKPLAEEQSTDQIISPPPLTTDQKEKAIAKKPKASKEKPVSANVGDEIKVSNTVKDQERKIPETIVRSQDVIKMADAEMSDQDFGEINHSIDIASAGPIEYFISGITFYNELPGIDKPENKLAMQNYATGSHKGTYKIAEAEEITPKGRGVSEKSSQPTEDERGIDMNQSAAGDQQHFFMMVDEGPQYPGGKDALASYLRSSLKYPEIARKEGIEGNVSVSFIIEENGQVSSVRINHGPGHGIDEEALRVISGMQFWQPAIKDGQPVKSLITMPISFRLK